MFFSLSNGCFVGFFDICKSHLRFFKGVNLLIISYLYHLDLIHPVRVCSWYSFLPCDISIPCKTCAMFWNNCLFISLCSISSFESSETLRLWCHCQNLVFSQPRKGLVSTGCAGIRRDPPFPAKDESLLGNSWAHWQIFKSDVTEERDNIRLVCFASYPSCGIRDKRWTDRLLAKPLSWWLWAL